MSSPVVRVDQYADGTAAKLWQLYIGDESQRTAKYKSFLTKMLKENNCKRLLDVACGTGVDSIMLLEEGFDVTSVDYSDKMLKQALKTRWMRRKEPAFDNWTIEEANWLTLEDDLSGVVDKKEGFDAVLCLGNSFAHLPDASGNGRSFRIAMSNFEKFVKPGGILMIDHRNFDFILDNGRAPTHNIYYNSKHVKDIKTSIVYEDGYPAKVILDYVMHVPEFPKIANGSTQQEETTDYEFRLSYHPHRVQDFTDLLDDAFGNKATQQVLGDFRPFGDISDPGFYLHVVHKPL